jgi:hypothetical protein
MFILNFSLGGSIGGCLRIKLSLLHEHHAGIPSIANKFTPKKSFNESLHFLYTHSTHVVHFRRPSVVGNSEIVTKTVFGF